MSPHQDSRDSRLRAWAYLSRVVEGPCHPLNVLIEKVGPEEAASAIRSGRLPDVLDRVTQARRDRDQSAHDLDVIHDMGGCLVTPDDPEWPFWRMLPFSQRECREDSNAAAPVALWKRGPLSLVEATSAAVSVVGTRAPSAYGEHCAIDMSGELADAGCTIVSGAAYGIDGCAHRAALAKDAPTIAILPGGVDAPYPRGHAELLNEIARCGALVSEYPPGTPPARFRFLARNRLIAAFTDAVLVVEAGKRSGARNTARWGRLLGKPVFAVPGPITSVSSIGCHQMIQREEARIITSAGDLLTESGLRERDAQRLLAGPAKEDNAPGRVTDVLSDTQLRVYDSLPMRGGSDIPSIAERSGVSSTSVQAALASLELSDLAVRTETGWRRARTVA